MDKYEELMLEVIFFDNNYDVITTSGDPQYDPITGELIPISGQP